MQFAMWSRDTLEARSSSGSDGPTCRIVSVGPSALGPEQVRRDEPAERSATRLQRSGNVDPGESAFLHRDARRATQDRNQLGEIRIVPHDHGPNGVAGIAQDRLQRADTHLAREPIVVADR